MTVICYKDGILAGDSGLSADYIKYGTVCKLFICENFIYGFSGDALPIQQYKKFLKKEITEYSSPNGFCFNAIKINIKSRKILFVESGDNFFCETEVLNNIYSIGVGREISIGAMLTGASAIDACKITCKNSICDFPIHYIDLNKKELKIETIINEN